MNNCKLSKNERIKKLYDENYDQLIAADVTTQVKKNGICFDGIIDEIAFEKCETKVIFLLKETNGNSKIKNPDGTTSVRLPEILTDWDYRAWLQQQQAYGVKLSGEPDSHKFYGVAYNKLCMWLDILYDCLNGYDVSFEEYKKHRYNENNFRNVLKSTAIVNLKKTWGKESTEWQDLYSYIHQKDNDVPSEVLRKEMEIIGPDIVICGGSQVFDFAGEIFSGKIYCKELANGRGLRYFKNSGTLFLDFYHPSCRGSVEKLFNYAKERFNMIKIIM